MGWERWGEACAQAEDNAAVDRLPTTEPAWEDVGVRRLVAIVLTALGTQAVEDPVDTGQLVWHLNQGSGHVRQLAAGLVGQDLAVARDIDPASVDMATEGVAAWVWLTRTWVEDGPWDGMPRGLAPGLSDPAVEVLTSRATHAALAALTRERGGYERGTLVTATDGRYEGQVATVMSSTWALDAERQTLNDGPLTGYEVLFRDPDAGHQREVLSAEQLRPATPDEQALERAQLMGIQTQFATVWEACERWAITLVWWHQQQNPERWLVDTDPHGRGPVVTSLLAAALHAVVRARGLDQPADGSRVHLTPLAPVATLLGSGWSTVVEALGQLPEMTSPTVAMLRAIQQADGEIGVEHEAVLDLAYDVAWAHTQSATVPSGTTTSDLAKGLVEPRLVDRLDALAATAQRQHEMDFDRSEDP
ncbi:hypothetical protein [Streptomyces sp. GS7]|uniref:hypothetical protein n=1 Tax=Streptomyces sp. GS7 TaxID=2692234 RepID=UPI001317BF7F|nr:hypothetical protein [Streptomyces sp. GS7]QHC23322.1 hypothetical protein GR130_19920 [Streptomyces sp. GS7]